MPIFSHSLARTLLTATALAGLVAPGFAVAKDTAPAAVKAPPIQFTEWRLKNGLRVIALPDTSTADVTTSVWYEVGAKHDPEGRAGFAHLFEHILSRKTENMPYNMINRLVEDVGGNRNASTSPDRTNYYETVPAQYLETLLWTHAERMARPVVDNEVFENERNVVKEELRQRVLAPPYGRLLRFVLPEVGNDTMPQRRPSIGSIEQLDSARLDDARAFHQAYYGPDTATLIVAGNFDMARLRGLVDKYFAAISARANPIPLTITRREGPRTSPRRVDVQAPNTPFPAVGYVWRTGGASDRDTVALEMLQTVLSRGKNSRIQSALIRTGKATDTIVFANPSEETGQFVAMAFAGAEQSPDEVTKIMASEIERFRREPVTAAELTEARNELFASALRERETAQGRAFELGEALVLTGDSRAADRRMAAIAAMKPADLQRAAKKWLGANAAVEVRYSNGEWNEASFANPVPMPTFATVPPVHTAPAQLKPEADRQAPPAPGPVPTVAVASTQETRLSNGIPLVTATTGPIPLATMAVMFPGGTAADNADTFGVAVMAASLIDKGTPTRNAQEIAAAFESLGVSFSAGADADGATFVLNGPVGNLDAAGKLLAELLQTANYPDRDFQTERKRRIDGFKSALANPGAVAAMVGNPSIFGDATYGRVATPAKLGRMTSADLAAHRARWYHPGTAKIVIAGGIAAADARKLAEDVFGSWRSDAPVPQAPTGRAGSALRTGRTIVVDMPGAGQAAVNVVAPTVARTDASFYPIEVANAVLGVGSNGRLFQEVRTKRALSYGAYSGVTGMAEAGTISASAQTKNESAADVAKVMLDEMGRLGREVVSDDDLAKRRLFINNGLQRSLETSAGYTTLLATLIRQGVPIAEAARIAANRDAVTSAAARQAAARYLDPAKANVIIVGDASKFLDKVKALRGDVTVVKLADLDFGKPIP